MLKGKNEHIFLILVFIGMFTLLTHDVWKNYKHSRPFQFSSAGDINTYYSYLPALFIQNDLNFRYNHDKGYWLNKGIDDKWAPRFTMGLAFMYCPFFLIGHGVATATGEVADGYSAPYSTAIMLGTLFYFFVGFFFLLKTLSYYFNRSTVIITGLGLFFATNLFHYTLSDGDTVHPYLFAIYSVMIYVTRLFWEKPQKKGRFLLVAILMGLATVMRPTELIVVLLPLLWGVYNKSTLIQRLQYFKTNTLLALTGFGCFMIPILPQLIFWKINTGQFLFDTYDNEGFFFLSPRIFELIFSYRKGWLVYTPFMVFALIGFFLLPRYLKQLKWVLPFIIFLAIYIASSWWCWWYGGSLTMRAMVQYYPLLAFPLASFIEYTISKKYMSLLFMPALLFCIYYNIQMTYKYNTYSIHYDSMTKEAFWTTFLKSHLKTHEFDAFNSQVRSPDYAKAITNEER